MSAVQLGGGGTADSAEGGRGRLRKREGSAEEEPEEGRKGGEGISQQSRDPAARAAERNGRDLVAGAGLSLLSEGGRRVAKGETGLHGDETSFCFPNPLDDLQRSKGSGEPKALQHDRNT